MRTALLLLALLLAAAPPAHAWPKPTVLWWDDSHWDATLFHPYAGPQRVRHDQRWDGQAWAPADWIAPHGGADAALEAFRRAEIIRDLRVRDGVPEVITGPGYLALAPRDRARLAATLDAIFAATARPPGAFRIVDGATDAPLGLYTVHGLQGH
jgi:hypothetical protein